MVRTWVDTAVPVYRRHAMPMDDLATIVNGSRVVLDATLPPAAAVHSNAAIDAAIEVLRWNRRLGGDARKRNRLLAAIYKGA
jgi:hypothetical protein